MHRFVWYAGKYRNTGKLSINASADALSFGHSVFTTIAVRNSSPLFLERHINRLFDSSSRFGLPNESLSNVSLPVSGLIEKNELINGRIKISLQGTGNTLMKGSESTAALLIESFDLVERPEFYDIGMSSRTVFSGSEIVGFKTGNYLEPVNEFRAARETGFDEAVRLNERREIVSACLANVFWRKSGEYFTPALSTGCLEGTTRAEVLKIISVTEVTAGADELDVADEVFLTSAGVGIKPVRSLAKKQFERVRIPSELEELARLFEIR